MANPQHKPDHPGGDAHPEHPHVPPGPPDNRPRGPHEPPVPPGRRQVG
jgi:hypothetical protein